MAGCARLLEWPPPARWGPPPDRDGRAFAAIVASPPEPAALRVLPRNVEAWTARWQLLAGAEQRLDVGYFILSQDVFGLAFLGHVRQRARAGVTVRILVDGLGLRLEPGPGGQCLPALADGSRVRIARFRPLPRRVAQALVTLSPTVALASNHDKVLVADGARSILGGRNIAVQYFAHPDDVPTAFTDLDVLVDGVATATALTDVFDAAYASAEARPIDPDPDGECAATLDGAYTAMDAWLRGAAEPAGAGRWWRELSAHPRLRGTLARVPTRRVRADTRVVDSAPRPPTAHDPVSGALFELLARARREVLIVTPYLVLTEAAAAAFEAAGRRGVATTVLTNSPLSSDNALSQQLFMEQWPRLVARVPGLRVFVVGGRRNAHAKFAVFDGDVAMVGSNNLDPLSLTLNGEVAIVVRSPRLVHEVAFKAARLLRRGPPAVYEYRIRRDAAGRPVLDASGRPEIAFGPSDHTRPERWPAVTWVWRLLELVPRFPGVPRLF